jgi:hypothetical protein
MATNFGDKMTYETGDIFLIDSNAWYANLVKFLMRSPTLYHYILGRIYELIVKKEAPQWLMRKSPYYHAGMILDSTHIIEQQRIVEIDNIDTILKKKHCIIRRKNITQEEREKLVSFMTADLGKSYDVLLVFGKMLKWLTGIYLFALWMNLPSKEICINRISKMFYKMWKERWGYLSIWGDLVWSLTTTNDMYYYALNHLNIYLVEESNA